MDVRRCLTAVAVAVPCLCLAALPASAQTRPTSRASQPAAFDLRSLAAPAAEEDFRIQQDGAPASRRSGIVRSWAMDRNAEFGFGRFTVPNSARPRTHTERMRGGMDRETRGIAGAGMHIRF